MPLPSTVGFLCSCAVTESADERLGETVNCSECGSTLVRRTARRGPNAGNDFWGCSAFPKCRVVVPSCSKCASPMVRRKAKRGVNAGSEFWGCSTFPKCRFMAQIEDEAAEPVEGGRELAEPDGATPEEVCRFSSPPPERSSGFLRKTFALIDSTQRWFLESDEPDATDRWNKEHRLKVLSYLYDRDQGRCGLCTAEIRRQDLKRAQVEHIIPKDFVRFVLSAEGEASHGGYYESKLHGMDNLQIAHPRCNKKKGDTADVYSWRHPEMPQRVAATATDGRVLMLPPTVPQV